MFVTHNHYHIIYSDTVLPLNSTGENTHVASLSGIGESDLERCIGSITSTNKDVKFNTIQYSKNNSKIYFYTDKPINVSGWKIANTIQYNKVAGINRILDSLDTVLAQEKNLNTGYISAYDLSEILAEMNNEYTQREKMFENRVKETLKAKIGESCSFIFYGFNDEDNTLKAGFKRYETSEWEDIYFTKHICDLRLVESTSIYAKNILSAAHSEISDYYDFCSVNKKYREESAFDVRSLDGLMRVGISKHGVAIRDTAYIYSKMEVFSPSYSSEYAVDCNSSRVLEKLEGNKSKLFKNVYIKIDHCPNWCKQRVLDYRLKQVKKEIEIIRRKEFFGKLNPFKKKQRSK